MFLFSSLISSPDRPQCIYKTHVDTVLHLFARQVLPLSLIPNKRLCVFVPAGNSTCTEFRLLERRREPAVHYGTNHDNNATVGI